MAAQSTIYKLKQAFYDGFGEGHMHAGVGPRNADLTPRLADVAATANAPEADTPSDGRAEIGVTRAYVHWHDPDTVTIHPFKDTPLGDAA